MGKDSSQEMRRTQAEKMLKQPKKLRAKWISRLFTLIMVAALSVATMGLLIKTTVLNADFTSKELAKDENIGKLYTEANQTLASSAQMYRIPASYADSLITKKQFRQDVEIAIKRIYDGQVTQIVDTNTLSSQIQTNGESDSEEPNDFDLNYDESAIKRSQTFAGDADIEREMRLLSFFGGN